MAFEMKKIIIGVLSVFLVILTFAACDISDENTSARITGYVGDASPQPQTPGPSGGSKMYNGVFNIEIEVPDDWIIFTVNEKNLTETKEQSGDITLFDVIVYNDGGCGMELLEIWNCESSSDRKHASLTAFIEAYDGVTEAEYVEATAEAFSGDFEGYSSVIEENGKKKLGDRECGFLKYKTETPEEGAVYYEEYYITEIDVSTFAVVCVTYWDGNEQSYNAAQDVIKGVKIG
jgi:hypothetical protein